MNDEKFIVTKDNNRVSSQTHDTAEKAERDEAAVLRKKAQQESEHTGKPQPVVAVKQTLLG